MRREVGPKLETGRLTLPTLVHVDTLNWPPCFKQKLDMLFGYDVIQKKSIMVSFVLWHQIVDKPLVTHRERPSAAKISPSRKVTVTVLLMFILRRCMISSRSVHQILWQVWS